MNKPELLRKLELIDREGEYSDLSIKVVEDLINETKDIETMYELVWDYCDNEMIYYSQAFNYLMDNNITDFEESIKEFGCTNVCGIAFYYLYNEVNAIIRELGE